MEQIVINQTTPSDDEDEIDLKEIFSVILNYKKSILLITAVTTLLALYHAYFSTNIYQSDALIKIAADEYNYRQSELMDMAMGYQSNIIEDETVIIQTQEIAEKALKNLNIGTRYFITKRFKTYELYKDSPFVVTTETMDSSVEGTLFTLLPLSETKFRLLVEPSLKTKVASALRSLIGSAEEEPRSFRYNHVHRFGERIETPFFTFTIQKVHSLSNRHYSFSVIPNEYMDGDILGGLSASPYTKEGSIMELDFTDNVPLRASEILNAVINAYIEDRLLYRSEGAKKKLRFIDLQLKAINKTLEGSAKKLQSFKATNIIVDLSDKAQLTSSKLSNLESQLYDINMQIDVMENILNYIKTHKDIRGINMGSTQEVSPVISSLIAEIQKATSLYATLSVNYTKAHPDVLKIDKQLDSLKKSLKEAILSSLRTLNKNKYSLQNIIEEHKNALKSLPEQEQKLEQLTRNFMVNEKIYSMLLEERAETAIAQSSTVSDTRVIQAASLPGGPIQPKRKLMIMIGFILGLILGIALAFLRDFLDNTIKSVEDIEKLTTVPIYGVIPYVDSKKGIDHYTESLRVIWVNLEFAYTGGKSKLITFTSSVSGEGKTLTISQLGYAIAKSHKSAIILDLDMRKSTLHKHYKLPNTTGMSTLLAHKNTLDEVIQDTQYDNLKIITSGPKPPNPTELIMADSLETIIKELGERFDYILLDSPPIGLVADAMKIMRMSDITLIMLKANFSKKDFIKNINRYSKDKKINLGYILNGVKESKNYGYGYGYGYN